MHDHTRGGIANQLVQVWRCEKCKRDILGVDLGRCVGLANDDAIDSLTLTTVAPDGWHVNAPCSHCGGAVEIIYWHAAIATTGAVVGVPTIPVALDGRGWSVGLN